MNLFDVVTVINTSTGKTLDRGKVVAVFKKNGRTWVRVHIDDSSFEVPACVTTARTKFRPTENVPFFIVRR